MLLSLMPFRGLFEARPRLSQTSTILVSLGAILWVVPEAQNAADFAQTRAYSNGSEHVFQVLERESGLLDWRTEHGTAFLVTLSHDPSAENSRIRLRLGDALDWTASCPYLEVRKTMMCVF